MRRHGVILGKTGSKLPAITNPVIMMTMILMFTLGNIYKNYGDKLELMEEGQEEVVLSLIHI